MYANVNAVQRETYYSVLQCVQSMKNDHHESIFRSLSIDEAVVLNKYITAAYENLSKKDQSKSN